MYSIKTVTGASDKGYITRLEFTYFKRTIATLKQYAISVQNQQ